MKNILFIIAFYLVTSIELVNAQSCDTIYIPKGTAPLLDGVANTSEWSDAAMTTITAGSIMYKYAFDHLYIAFVNSPYLSSTGIYIDKNHDCDTTPQPDDSWMHGSAGQYEFVGNGTDWQIKPAPFDWAFVLNTSSEYMIPLSKLGITGPGNYSIGILFSFSDWSTSHTDEKTWPEGGYPNCGNPSTWATAIINVIASTEEIGQNDKDISIFPNPCNSEIRIQFANTDGEAQSLYICNSLGQTIYKKHDIIGKEILVDCHAWPGGMYIVNLRNSKMETNCKLILDK